jgi:hypothetical protein
MKKFTCIIIISAFLLLPATMSFAKVFSYSFPKAPAKWGEPVSFNNLSPGFFQVMYQSDKGVTRIATYGIEGGAMDELTAPQLVMVFTFDGKGKSASLPTE